MRNAPMRALQIMGTETEYAIVSDPKPYMFLDATRRKEQMEWAFAQRMIRYLAEDPFREFAAHSSDSRLYLQNGGCIYPDLSHVEHASPETSSPEIATLYDLAGIEMIKGLCEVTKSNLEYECQSPVGISAYRSVVDSEGNSWGYHENHMAYLEYASNLAVILEPLYTFLASRQIFSGTGELVMADGAYKLLLSQKSRYVEVELGKDLRKRKAMIKETAMDDTHCPSDHTRVQVVCGDQNLSQKIIYFNLATVDGLLEILAATLGESTKWPRLVNPVAALHIWNADPSVRLPTQSGKEYNAIEIQKIFFDIFTNMHRTRYNENRWIFALWEWLIDSYENDQSELEGVVEWYTKKVLLQKMIERGVSPDSPKLMAASILFHQIYPEPGLFLHLNRHGRNDLYDSTEIRDAILNAPLETRAFTRGQAVRMMAEGKIRGLEIPDWSTLCIETSKGKSRTVNILDPTRPVDLYPEFAPLG